ncbi:MAG: hypothetical protein EXX96DRAFT_605196 [Benjaminiella poitrasii]|nr:MAG: hypothetical protein EXX96DRAFT_605196 [Benjaminiella poitrasii]
MKTNNKRQQKNSQQFYNKRAKQQSSLISFFNCSSTKASDPKTECQKIDDQKIENQLDDDSFEESTLLSKSDSQESKSISKDKVQKIEDSETEVFTTSVYTYEFDNMLDTVLNAESYLFSKDELTLFDSYKFLNDESKHLIVRLLMRKHGWIRKSKLNYSNHISDMNAATADLESKKFILTSITDLSEAVKILSKDEMKLLTKERNISTAKNNPKKEDYEKEILKFGSNATGSIITHYTDSTVDNIKIEKLWISINAFLGECVKVNPKVYAIFQRLQVVYYRINSLQDTTFMSSSILARMSKRTYPSYESSRSNAIWNSRDDLLKYENALLIEKEFYQHLEQLSMYNYTKSKKNISAEGGDPTARELMIKSWTLCEDIIGIWEDCVIERSLQERPYYLRRFEAGWVYTRLLDHGTDVLAKLLEYELEALILQKLLDQHMYRLGKRGKWYDRLALIQSIYLNKSQPRVQKKIALKTCIDAIQDPRVHQIYLHEIHKRIKRLEKDLCIPKREQHDFSYMSLTKPKEITIHGERISDQVTGKKSIWRSDDGSECTVEQVAIEYYKKKGYKGLHCENGIIRMIVRLNLRKNKKQKQLTIFLLLQAMLLFWDVIFAPIPGVFETPYQSEPLDLRTDSFYESRIDIINKRLREIEEGNHLTIITEVDNRERPRHTMCVGINWNYEFQDIIEIAECIGSSSLVSLCKLFFEEFGQRQGGMPDLCCWNYDKKECLFSEVKGPKDTLSKTQKIWIEALIGFGIQVEVCHVKVWNGENIFLKMTKKTSKNNKNNPSDYFSSPIISPKNELGYYLHVPPFDQGKDRVHLAITSMKDLKDDPPKVYEVRPLREVISDDDSENSIFPESANTSSSSLQEWKVAERQIFQQESPATFDTIDGIYRTQIGRHHNFNKLKEIMKSFEEVDQNNENNSITQSDSNRDNSSFYVSALSTSSSINSNKSKDNFNTTSNSPYKQNGINDFMPLKRYDSSNIVRYTLVDKELPRHNLSTSSKYHQRLNEYDNSELITTSTNKSSARYSSSTSGNDRFTDYHSANSYPSLAPPPPSYYNPSLEPRLLTAAYPSQYSRSSASSGSAKNSKYNKENYKNSFEYSLATTDSNYSALYNQQLLQHFNFSDPRTYFDLPIGGEYTNNGKNQAIYLASPNSIHEEIIKDKPRSMKTWRPYFTFITTLCMFAYFIACLVKNYQLSGNVIQLSPFNIMIGPSAQTLIYTGARYSPCIRDSYLYPVTESIYQCPNTAASGKVTRPIFNDQSKPQYPFSSKNISATLSDERLCNLQEVCGGTEFRISDRPDQGYRFISALFMHSGVIQLIINSIVHIKVGVEVEKRIHPLRYGTIWLVSGVFGYIFGSLFIPEDNVNVGCSVSLMGVMAFLFIDLIRNWQKIVKPWKVLIHIIIYFVITLAIGLLPGYDNYAHLGGFIGGIMITLAILPMTSISRQRIGKYKFAEYSVHICLMRIMAIGFIAVLLWILVHLYIERGDKEVFLFCRVRRASKFRSIRLVLAT